MSRQATQALALLLAAGLLATACAGPGRASYAERAEAASMAAPGQGYLSYAASMEVEIRDKAAPYAAVQGIAQRMGGRLDHYGDGHIHIWVPADSLDAALAGIGALGKVLRQQMSARDEAMPSEELRISLENARASRERYLALLQKAQSVPDILAIERELERLNTQIAQLEFRAEALRSRIDMSAVHVHFRQRLRPGPLGWVFVGLWRGVRFLFVWD